MYSVGGFSGTVEPVNTVNNGPVIFSRINGVGLNFYDWSKLSNVLTEANRQTNHTAHLFDITLSTL